MSEEKKRCMFMFCPRCGKKMEDAPLCPHCGVDIKRFVENPKEMAAETALPAEIAPQEKTKDLEATEVEEETATTEAPAEEGKERNKFVLVGIAILTLIGAAVTVLTFTVFLKGNAIGPRETLDQYFKAQEENRAEEVIDFYDPEDFEKMAQIYGMSPEELKMHIIESSQQAGAGKVKYENLNYKIDIQGDRATAQIISGTVIYTDPSGQTETREIHDTTLNLVKRNGKWYIKIFKEEAEGEPVSPPAEEGATGQ